jgi:hypothetical protein
MNAAILSRRVSKATIINTHTDEHISVMYNPEELRLEQGNIVAEVGIPGRDASPVQYVRGKNRSLSMELFFDTYEEKVPTDVRTFSNRVVRLLDRLPQTGAPPVLQFVLGQFNFQCVLVDAAQRFTMFLRDGTPVRTTLAVRFQEYVRLEFEVTHGFFGGPPALQHTIAQGETLSGLAGDYLGDPTAWRRIAEANKIDDPLNLPAGVALVVPGGSRR